MAQLIASIAGLALLAVLATTVTMLVVVAAAGYGTFWGVRWLWRDHCARAAAIEHQRAELIARADIQHQWYLSGDPRGTYGRFPPAATA